jgi:uncharacterized membrane protein HdeD (DUF308 family)
MGAATEGKRVWVIIAAIILLAFAIVAVSQCSGKYDAFCYVINIITIVGCIFGIIGAFRLHAGWLNIFCVTLMVLIVLEIIFIIIALVGDYAARDILWNFVVLGLLCITLAFATDLRRVVHGSTVIY